MQPKTWMSAKEVAEHFGCSVSSIYRLQKQGLPSHKLRGRRVFNRTEVDEWARGE